MNLRRFSPIDYRTRWINFVWTLGAVALTTAVLLLLRSTLSNQVIALLYLLPVMLSATRWGILPALTASLTSFFAFNFFFLFPTFTFAVGNPEELLALMIFLIVAVIISQAVASANLHAVRAEIREREATTLYTLSRVLEEQTGLDETLASVTRMITEVFGFAGCEILAGPDDRALQSWARFTAAPAAGAGQAAGELRAVDIPLAARHTNVGILRLHVRETNPPPDASTLRLLTTFAAQAGLHRTHPTGPRSQPGATPRRK